jgi:iron complex outermembrane receptor protein
MKKTLLLAALCVLPLCAQAQEKTERLDSVVVSASRAANNTPVTFTSVGKAELGAADPSHSLPMALNLLPSVVTYHEGGNGLGNSAMTIRGSKGSQINVTLNGITLNDAESQEVFWVNIPSLTAMLSSVQVQRGLGTSASGAGAFGASINMNTAFVGDGPTGSVDLSGGSFGTFIGSGAFSTGLLPGGWYFNVAANLGHTDGYIRNAKVNSQSVFAVLGWLHGPRSLRFTYLMGNQKSGITWDGIDLEQFYIDPTYNGAGKYKDEQGNTCYYDNQTDNYAQHHFQLNYTRAFGEKLSWSNTFNYTRGDGYDEYYKTGRKLKRFGFPKDYEPAVSDMIYQKKMDNDLFVANSSLAYRGQVLDLTAGVNASWYRGGHWGEIVWVKETGESHPNVDWYNNLGRKQDLSAFVRAEYNPFSWLTAYADLQYRHIRYTLKGVDDDWLEYGAREEDRLNYGRNWGFFNPRAGVTAHWSASKLYASVALGHREPGRGDIKENVKGDALDIKPESMVDVEAGYAYNGKCFAFSANVYAMEYSDMLLETGRLSSSGYAIKENVPRAWRRGVELALGWKPCSWLRLDHNSTFSVNQIADYTSYAPYDDDSGRTFPVPYGRTTMLMSPSVIAMFQVAVLPWKGATLSWNGKYVGKQYLDNTCREDLVVPEYFVAGISAEQNFPLRHGNLCLSGFINNVFNRQYYAAGWRWESYNADSGEIATGSGVYPQAPFNFILKLRYSF